MIRQLLFIAIIFTLLSGCYPSLALRGGLGSGTKQTAIRPQAELDLGVSGHAGNVDLLNFAVSSTYYNRQDKNHILAVGFKTGVTKFYSNSSVSIYLGAEVGQVLIPNAKNGLYKGLKSGIDFKPWTFAGNGLSFKNLIGIGLQVEGGIVSRPDYPSYSQLGVSLNLSFSFP